LPQRSPGFFIRHARAPSFPPARGADSVPRLAGDTAGCLRTGNRPRLDEPRPGALRSRSAGWAIRPGRGGLRGALGVADRELPAGGRGNGRCRSGSEIRPAREKAHSPTQPPCTIDRQTVREASRSSGDIFDKALRHSN